MLRSSILKSFVDNQISHSEPIIHVDIACRSQRSITAPAGGILASGMLWCVTLECPYVRGTLQLGRLGCAGSTTQGKITHLITSQFQVLSEVVAVSFFPQYQHTTQLVLPNLRISRNNCMLTYFLNNFGKISNICFSSAYMYIIIQNVRTVL